MSRKPASTPERFNHPIPRYDTITQIMALVVSAVLALIMVIEIPLVLFAGFPLLFALLIIVTCLGLIPFSIMPTTSAPEVTVSEEGIELHPRFWKGQFVPWSDVTAAKVYPLMPSDGSEITRKLMVGRRKYKPMEGIMLVIPLLPLIYRFHGLAAGEGFHGVIALTNRSHKNYERLISLIPIPVSESL